VIIDLRRFLAAGRPRWERLETVLDRLGEDPAASLDLAQAKELHRLYQETAADLARLAADSAEAEVHPYLAALVARAYAEIHETRQRVRLSPWAWLSRTLPCTFRRHAGAFLLAAAVTALGALFGGAVLSVRPAAKEVLLPFSHLQADPGARVAWEESAREDRLRGRKATFSSELMTHNTQISILAVGLGITWGVGTVLLLFSNGVVLGAVAVDYVAAGQAPFLLGWLLPHGAVEIPAVLIAGQAGLLLAGALLGWGDRTPLRERLRRVRGAIITLTAGAALLLVWAGLVEAFLSQYHEPVLPYGLKIAFGAAELVALTLFLGAAGRQRPPLPGL
jgi:uncharacterized membrane protein SpoIIM required for sporulation